MKTYINQHNQLNLLSPSGVNTIRIVTNFNNSNEFEFLAARIRISVNNIVDNMAAGNICAGIDLNSGIVNTKGFYSDITKPPVLAHPITKESIIGFEVPFWKEVLKLSKKASYVSPQNKSIGWDIVITEKGPFLLEGNHDWCKLVWQLPVEKGLKNMIQI